MFPKTKCVKITFTILLLESWLAGLTLCSDIIHTGKRAACHFVDIPLLSIYKTYMPCAGFMCNRDIGGGYWV